MAVGSIKLPISGTSSPQWTRPTDWLTIPTPGNQEVIGLMAVYDDGANYVALQCTAAYTVDWGDGTITNYATNTVASRQYVFSTIPSGTTTTKGFRQVLVRITPQAGQNLTAVNFGVINPTNNKSTAVGWLEFDIRTPNCLPTYLGSSNSVRYGRLEKITIRQMSTANMANIFNNLYSLKSVYIEPSETTGCTQMNSLFANCFSLEEVNLFDTSTAVNTSLMFAGCYNLQTVPNFNLSSSTNTVTMFQNCYSLTTIPAFVLGTGTNATQMFLNCYSLVNVGLMNTSGVINFSAMFNTCISLRTIPLIDTGAGTNFAGMFGLCSSLTTIPLLNTANATDMGSMFNQSSLIYLPALNMANVLTVNSMFTNCYGLRELPALNMPLVSNFSFWLSNITAISKSNITGARFSHSYSNQSLSRANIVTIFTNLGTASGAQTITVSTNPGYAGLTAGERLIATNKGWTIA